MKGTIKNTNEFENSWQKTKACLIKEMEEERKSIKDNGLGPYWIFCVCSSSFFFVFPLLIPSLRKWFLSFFSNESLEAGLIFIGIFLLVGITMALSIIHIPSMIMVHKYNKAIQNLKRSNSRDVWTDIGCAGLIIDEFPSAIRKLLNRIEFLNAIEKASKVNSITNKKQKTKFIMNFSNGKLVSFEIILKKYSRLYAPNVHTDKKYQFEDYKLTFDYQWERDILPNIRLKETKKKEHFEFDAKKDILTLYLSKKTIKKIQKEKKDSMQ